MSETRTLLVACCVLLCGLEADAQTRLGVLGGVNLGEVAPGESGLTYSTRAFPAVGATIDVGLGPNVFVRAEPMFLRKGSDLAIAADGFLFDEDVSLRLQLGYVELPLFLVASKGGGWLLPYLLVGPTFGYLVDAKAMGRGEEVDVRDSLRRGELSISIGGGLQFPAGSSSIFLEARYSHGLWGLYKDDVQDPRPVNRGVLLGAGLTVPVRREPVRAEPSPVDRDWHQGFWMSFGLGFGSARVSCRESELLVCGPTEKAQGPTGQLTVGWTAVPKLLLGVEADFWSGHADGGPSAAADSFFLTESPTLGSVSLTGSFYPLHSRGFFIKCGAGPSFHTSGREGILTSWGWGVTAGLGYDFRVARNLYLTPVASVQLAWLGDVQLFPNEDVSAEPAELNTGHGLRHDVIQLGLRVTTH